MCVCVCVCVCVCAFEYVSANERLGMRGSSVHVIVSMCIFICVPYANMDDFAVVVVCYGPLNFFFTVEDVNSICITVDMVS